MQFPPITKIRNFLATRQTKSLINEYLTSGQIPWKPGYSEYKTLFIEETINNVDMMQRFRNNDELPDGYGYRLDERVVEYPWLLSRLSTSSSSLLDAGGILDFPYLLNHPIVRSKSLVIYTLSPVGQCKAIDDVSYIFGDLRKTILREGVFDEIACISTLEHIGMDNTFLYTSDTRYREANTVDYRQVLLEFWRILVPNGRLFLTFPYGKYQDCGWLQQFNRDMLSDVLTVFKSNLINLTFYRYHDKKWAIADQESCDDCLYFDVHKADHFDTDYAAAARSVVCVELYKGS